MKTLLTVNKIKVHNGGFHADDVFACALVKYFVNSNVEIERVAHQSNFDEKSSDEWIIDVGRRLDPAAGFFDHHHIKSDIAAAGRVYGYLKECGYISNRVAKTLDPLVRDIDLNDVGIKKSAIGEFSWTISQMNAANIYGEEQYAQFNKAIDMSVEVIKGVVEFSNKIDHSIDIFSKAEKFKLRDTDKFEICEISEYAPFDGLFEFSRLDDADTVIWYDADQQKWKAQTVPDQPGSFGKRGRAIKVADKLPEGVEFVHVGEFFMVASSKEALVDYLKEYLKENLK